MGCRWARKASSRASETTGGGTPRALSPSPEVELPPWPFDYSLFCFGPRNGFRRGCRWLAKNKWFDYLTIVLILVSSICLALDSPKLDPHGELRYWLKELDYVWTSLFAAELCLKVVAYGLLFGPVLVCAGKKLLEVAFMMPPSAHE